MKNYEVDATTRLKVRADRLLRLIELNGPPQIVSATAVGVFWAAVLLDPEHTLDAITGVLRVHARFVAGYCTNPGCENKVMPSEEYREHIKADSVPPSYDVTKCPFCNAAEEQEAAEVERELAALKDSGEDLS